MRGRRRPDKPSAELSQVFVLRFLPGEQYALLKWAQLIKDYTRVAVFPKDELNIHLAYYLPISMKSTEYVLKMILDIEGVGAITYINKRGRSVHIEIEVEL